ncbi:Calcium-binding EF-hand family protein [Klebsormidium nitens]|uniref:Calcium-binding EF-hand family protein n=1 Tax=Klebsormidium nitens TaxID=105231 RepID=A0A1Y1HX40_KLENI|nr:Calcium-binding EF-hand family protein [Klebsormidium nitens]|eukprot:GAQ81729.1 Calcium-binding EF-hand family protein [Klebsormidium nitens]
MFSAGGGGCEEAYGFLPCSNSLAGSVSLIVAYGYILLQGANLISDGSELLLEVLNPGLIGGLLLPILGALPDCAIILMSGIGGTVEEAQEQVAVGVGTLAGSTIMLCTIAWGGSLIAGRCDIGENGLAINRKLTKGWSLTETGVSTDVETPRNAIIMLGTVFLYLVVQVPAVFGHNRDPIVDLVGLVLATLTLAAYCVYQVLVPELQKRRIRFARQNFLRRYAVGHVHKLAGSTGKDLYDANGNINPLVLKDIFRIIDRNGDGEIDADEIKAMVTGMSLSAKNYQVEESDVDYWMNQFDEDKGGSIGEEEFVKGMSRWASAVTPNRTTSQADLDLEQALLPNGAGADDDDDDDSDEQKEPPSKQAIALKATMLLVLGTALIGVFSDPLVDSITIFSRESSIPPFFVSFVVTPFASNASELVSSLLIASKKQSKKISLTFAQVYGAVTMNNSLALGVFLALVFFRGLMWDFSSEVTVIMVTVLSLGIMGSQARTLKLWHAFVMLAFYPLSIGLVAFLDYGLGWH